MSDQSTRRVRIDEVSGLFKRDGGFVETSHGGRQKDGNFVAWGRANFREVVPELPPPAVPEQSAESEQQSEEAQAEQAGKEAAMLAAAEAAAAPPPPPPPPVDQDPPPSAEEILAEIEAAREEGRANGYAQGIAAARQELSEALLALRSMESELVFQADEARQQAANMMAQHVRRIAQDLAGTVFAEIPQEFIERIRRAADLFIRANTEFTISISRHDAKALTDALAGDEVFASIRVIADPDLVRGAFRLSSRDLEVEDTPLIEGGEEE
ncbi:MAG: FliH/SctL family protein [Beijerinckiaceae bacterium]|jgi:flagellar biosynthesis/type III secretory pathway protein FliH